MSILLWVVLVVGALLGPAQAIDEYSQLHQNYQPGVDIVLDQLQSDTRVQNHFLLFQSIDKSDIEGSFGVRHVSHHFTLKPTWCAKGTTAVTSQRCRFRNDRPMMDCTVCYKMFNGAIDTEPKPYVHCIQKPKLTAAMLTTRSNRCGRLFHLSGAATLVAKSMTDPLLAT